MMNKYCKKNKQKMNGKKLFWQKTAVMV